MIVGRNDTMSKAITVAEITKRSLESGFRQSVEIGRQYTEPEKEREGRGSSLYINISLERTKDPQPGQSRSKIPIGTEISPGNIPSDSFCS